MEMEWKSKTHATNPTYLWGKAKMVFSPARNAHTSFTHQVAWASGPKKERKFKTTNSRSYYDPSELSCPLI